MVKQASNLKILLLQLRDDKETMMEELYEFVQFSGLRKEQFTVLNTFTTTEFDVSAIEGHDALFIGGSSDVSVLKCEEFLFLADCKRLLRHCYDYNIPVFSSCFGFQLMIEEFGGKIIIDKKNLEMGIYDIILTEAGEKDPLFHDIPNPFPAVSGHQERALNLPTNAMLLAYTPLCPFHAIKLENKPMYGFQFHPEIEPNDIIARLLRYQTIYLEDAEEYERIKKTLIGKDTSYANSLVEKFVNRIVLNHSEIPSI